MRVPGKNGQESAAFMRRFGVLQCWNPLECTLHIVAPATGGAGR